jgi:hypothetical protein
MAALQYHLATKAFGWLASNNVSLTSDGELELHNLLDLAEKKAAVRPSFAKGVVPLKTSELSEVEGNLEKILGTAAQMTPGSPITAVTLQKARLSLCPIFPFC